MEKKCCHHRWRVSFKWTWRVGWGKPRSSQVVTWWKYWGEHSLSQELLRQRWKNSLGLANIACRWRKGTTANTSAIANVVESLLQPLSHIKEALIELSLKFSCYVGSLSNYLLKQFTWAWFGPLRWMITQNVENIYPRIYNLTQATPTPGLCHGVFTVRVVFQIQFRRCQLRSVYELNQVV